MKALFMTSGIKKINEVYTKSTREKLADKLEFLEPVTSADQLAARPDLADAEKARRAQRAGGGRRESCAGKGGCIGEGGRAGAPGSRT